jgi:hypothetical protein
LLKEKNKEISKKIISKGIKKAKTNETTFKKKKKT